MLKTIVLITSKDPKTSSHVGLCVDVAKLHGATVTGFVAIDEDELRNVGPAGPGAFSYRQSMVQQRVENGFHDAEESLEMLRDVFAGEGIAFSAHEAIGEQDQRLTDAWRFQDLAVLPSQVWQPGLNELGDEESLLHFVAMGLRPLLVVPQGVEGLPKKALVALSGSLDSAKAFKQFVQMRPFGDIPVHIVTVGKPKSGDTPAGLLASAVDYASAHGLEASSEALPQSDQRIDTLIAHAEEVGADCFVIGSSYRHFMLFTRFGSHATGLLRDARHPVFLSH